MRASGSELGRPRWRLIGERSALLSLFPHTIRHSRHGLQSSTHRDRTADLAGDPRRVAELEGIARSSREQGPPPRLLLILYQSTSMLTAPIARSLTRSPSLRPRRSVSPASRPRPRTSRLSRTAPSPRRPRPPSSKPPRSAPPPLRPVPSPSRPRWSPAPKPPRRDTRPASS